MSASNQSSNEIVIQGIEVFDGNSILIHNTDNYGESKVLEGLVQKHNVDRPGYSASAKAKNWNLLAKEYFTLTNQDVSVEILKEKWKNVKFDKKKKDEDMKKLEQSIAHALNEGNPGQRFEVNQSQEGDQTNTTIVVVNNDDEFENPTSTNITTTDVVSNKYALTESKDLVSLAIDESGLEQNQNWTLPRIFGGTNLSVQQVEEEYYSNEAEEILNSDTDPKLAKKRLKWENKIRAEDAAFSKKKREIEQETENYKRKFQQEQFQITQMEIELKSKKTKLETFQKDIDAFLKRS